MVMSGWTTIDLQRRSGTQSAGGSYMGEELLGNHKFHAVGGSTTARVIAIILQVESVVKGDFFPSLNRTAGDNPDSVVRELRFGVRRTTVVQPPGGVPGNIAIQVLVFVQRKNKHVVRLTTANRFGLINFFTYVLQQNRAWR